MAQVTASSGEVGRIIGSFGKSGKSKVNFPAGVPRGVRDAKADALSDSARGAKSGGAQPNSARDAKADVLPGGAPSAPPVTVSLAFKRYIFDTDKKCMAQ